MRDHYASFFQLLLHEREGVDFRREVCARLSPTAVVAIHGGGIEPGTSEIARAIAGDDLSSYLFEGIKGRDNRLLHVGSTLFDDPCCLDLLARAETVVSIHGSGRPDPLVVVSGLADDLVVRLIENLKGEGFPSEHDRGAGAGSSPANVCNRGRSGRGVQVEVSQGMRRLLFRGLTRQARREVTPAFWRFVAAVRAAVVRPEGTSAFPQPEAPGAQPVA